MQQPMKDELLFSALYTVFARKWLILASFLLIFVGVLFFISLITPRYDGTSQVLVDLNPRYQVVLFPGFTQPSGRSPAVDPTQNLVEILTNQDMARSVVREFEIDKLVKQRKTESTAMRDVVKRFLVGCVSGLKGIFVSLGIGEPAEEKTEQKWFDEAVEEFVTDWNRIEVEKETSMINVTILGPDPELSKSIATWMVARLDHLVGDMAREKFIKMQSFAQQNMDKSSRELESATAELAAFLEEADPAALEKEQDVLISRRDALQTSLIEARSRSEGASRKLEELYRQMETEQVRVATTAEVEARNPLVNSLKSELQSLEVQLAAIALQLKPDHPTRKELEERIRTTRNYLGAEVEREIQSRTSSEEFNPLYIQTISQLADAIAEAAVSDARLNASLAQQTEVVSRLEQVNSSLIRSENRRTELDRRVLTAESYYLSLKQRAMELEALSRSPEGEFDIKVVDPAFNPDGEEASTPLWNLVAPVALVAGMFFAIFLAFFLEYWRNSYRSPLELEAETGVEVLAMVPRLRRPKS